jgi:serine/threonine protein kinase
LPPTPSGLRRFEQEARAVASLSHPNILAVHDIGQDQGRPFMVSELLDGESLREALTRGALPQRKAIDYAVQIAHGLAAAHGRDIAHRDLKPDNIFITREGRVKTGLGPATDVGAVMGTVGYMSPEQVRGGAVDMVFSVGAVTVNSISRQITMRRATTFMCQN